METPTRHALLGDLSVVDLLLQGEVTDEPVDVAAFDLAVAVHAAHSLGVVTGVPGSIEDYDAIGPDQIYPQAARSERQNNKALLSFKWKRRRGRR